jgi:acyl-coenzyme A synthetase/AMP-(fatty) acid ligase
MANPVMALRRRQRQRDVGQVPRAGGYAAGWDVPPAFNFTRDVVEAYAADPLRAALTFVDGEGIVDRRTFAEVAGDAARWAHLLRTRLDRGDRVMIVIGKVPAWHGAMLGAIKGGLVAVPCPNMLRARDLAFRVRDSGARLVIADRECEPEIEEMRNQIGDIVAVLYVDEAKAELSRYRGVAPTEDTTAGESALILYTSGTTKDPKGVVHTHAYTWAQRMQAGQWLDAREGDVVWCTASTGWAKAVWNVLLGPWSQGAEVVVHQSAFEPEERLSLIQKLGITVLCQAPTEYRMMAKLDKLGLAYAPKLRHAVSAGEPLNPEVIGTFQDALGITVHDGYGQTENSLLVANLPGAPVRPGSMGLPTEGHDVSIIDEAGHVCEPGAEGDIALLGRPPTLFRGYWNDPDATDAAFRDGWYVTGDRAIRDEEGYVWFVGRTDDVILSAAYRIGPFEVESALLEHPAVAESAVVGVPDADRGQIVKAFVVLRPGHEAGDELAVALQDHVKAITAPYKYPRAISFVDELPKTTSGKIRRSELRELGDAIEEFVPAAAAVPLHAVPDLAEQEAEALRLQAEETARRELARERARAAAAEAQRAQAEVEARRAAEEAERLRVEAEELYRIRALAEEQIREEAEAAARAQAETATQLEVVATDDDERARDEAEAAERARLEAEAEERARLAAEAAERTRLEAEAAERARVEAEEAERARAEAEAAERARIEALAAERARLEAEAAEQARLEAEAAERARLEAEAAERARLEAEAAERARLEAEEHARREAEEAERARAEAEAAERAREEAEAAERARAEAEAAERARVEAEAAERARLEAEAAEQARVEAEAAEQARVEAEAAERARIEAETAERLRVEAEEAERARLEAAAAAGAAAEPEAFEELDVGEADAGHESWRDARRRKREEAAQRKADAEAAKLRAKEEAEQRKRDAEAARAAEKQRVIDEREAAKQQAIEAKRRAEEERLAAKQRAEDEKHAAKQRAIDAKRLAEEEKQAAKQRAIDERAASKQRAVDERRQSKEADEQRRKDEIAAREAERLQREEEARQAVKAAEEGKLRRHDLARPRRGLARLLPGDEPEDDYGDAGDDAPVEPIAGIVERLSQYSGVPSGAPPPDGAPAHPTPVDGPDGPVKLEREPVAEPAPGDGADEEQMGERRSAP